jgi:hypothetical protein
MKTFVVLASLPLTRDAHLSGPAVYCAHLYSALDPATMDVRASDLIRVKAFEGRMCEPQP